MLANSLNINNSHRDIIDLLNHHINVQDSLSLQQSEPISSQETIDQQGSTTTLKVTYSSFSKNRICLMLSKTIKEFWF